MTTFIDLEQRADRHGYPRPSSRRDLWVTPRAPLDLPKPYSDKVRVLYWEGTPRAVFTDEVPIQVATAYAKGRAFQVAPPLLVTFGADGRQLAFRFDGKDYTSVEEPPQWSDLLTWKPGRLSEGQAIAVLTAVADKNRAWYQNDLSKRVMGVLPRIFPEGTVILYELLQNAADSGATRASFGIEGQTLLFTHNGYSFTENDVDAISFVNFSYKPPDTIGFMGLGFKAAYEISDRPRIYSPPFHFYFNSTEQGGCLFPQPLDSQEQLAEGFTTLFSLPLMPSMLPRVIQELERFDGRPLLYIGRLLRELSTPQGTFRITVERDDGGVRVVQLLDSRKDSPEELIIFHKEFKPSEDAVEEFSRSRGLEPNQYHGRKEQVAIAVQLTGGIADSERQGRLQAYLPTSVQLPVPFDIQGNFLLDASRQRLRNANGHWNSEHFREVVDLVAFMLEWAKHQSEQVDSWTAFYEMVPGWQKFSKELNLIDGAYADAAGDEEGEEGHGLMSQFRAGLDKHHLVPVSDREGALRFVGLGEACYVDENLESVLLPQDIARLSGMLPLRKRLSGKAKSLLAPYIAQFSVADLKARLEQDGWEQNVSAFSKGPGTREGRVQLTKILAYLERSPSQHSTFHSCRIVLTQNGVLRAAAMEEGAKKVHSLPDAEIAFPTEELESAYDIVHVGFRRELNRPGEMGLEPATTQDAVKALARVAPVLSSKVIAEDIILPLFQADMWKTVPDDRLMPYTRFLMQHSKEVELSPDRLKVKVRDQERLYLPPREVYFTKDYSIEGERLERLCSGTNGVRFLSDAYLRLPRTERGDWVRFFAELGVASRPRVLPRSSYFRQGDIESVRGAIQDPQLLPKSLRATKLEDIQGGNYAVDDFVLDPPIEESVRKLFTDKPHGWRDALADFARVLDTSWKQYADRLRKKLRYAILYAKIPTTAPVPAPSSFADFLRKEPWMPVSDIATTRSPADLVVNTPENRELADEETLFPYYDIQSHDFLEFLGIHQRPPESSHLVRLRNAVDRKIPDLEHFKAIYRELAEDRSLGTGQLRQEFATHPLIFVPGHEPSYLTSDRVLFKETTVLIPYFVPIAEVYPDLKDFFCQSLPIPQAEQLEHFARFLTDHIWKLRPPMTDNLRSSIVSCYRRFYNYLSEATEQEQESAQNRLKEMLGPSAVVFCSGEGWVDTSEKVVVYPDTSAYTAYLKDVKSVAIESHLKQLAMHLSEIEPLLRVLNLQPASRTVEVAQDVEQARRLDNDEHLASRLSLLVQKAVAIVEAEHAESESVSRNISLFLREWPEQQRRMYDIRFWQAPAIKIRGTLTHTNTTLFESNSVAHVHSTADHVDIYLVGDIIEVFDSVAEQLGQAIRLDLLPRSLREDVFRFLQGNLARLDHEKFEDLLARQLEKRGLAFQGDPELQRILDEPAEELLDSATQSAGEGGSSSGGGEEQPDTSGHSLGSRHLGGSSSNGGQTPQPPQHTVDDLLAQMPSFADASYGDDKIVDLTGNASWQPTALAGSRPGHGGGGRGGFGASKVWQEAYGKRGEAWVLELEKRALINVGRPDLVARVVHRSLENEGSPWDIESFSKQHPFTPIYIEVKSTPRADDFEVQMSANQIWQALNSSRLYYVYRVMEIGTNSPKAYVYDLKKVKDLIRVSSTNVSVTLPRAQDG